MFGREVILPTSLVAKSPDEPVTSSVPFVVDLRDALKTRMIGFEEQRNEQQEFRENAMTKNHGKPNSVKVKWFGYFGLNHPFGNVSRNFAYYGRDPGKSKNFIDLKIRHIIK